jgi:hypothetical protein
MLLRALIAGLCLSLLAADAAFGDAAVSFYSHGWGVRIDGYMYFPHAFVVIRRETAPDDARTLESYGFTAVSQGPDALTGPTRGIVKPAADAYRREAALHFTVEATDAQYQALLAEVAAWGGPGAAPYDLRRHNCLGFVAALAKALDLKLPPTTGMDPAKFLEEVRRLNPGRLVEANASPPLAGPPQRAAHSPESTP